MDAVERQTSASEYPDWITLCYQSAMWFAAASWRKYAQCQDLRRQSENETRGDSEDCKDNDVQDQEINMDIEHAPGRRFWPVGLICVNLVLFAMSSTLFVLSLSPPRPLYADRTLERQRNHKFRPLAMPCEFLLVANPSLGV